jgi:hypothetical protein
MYLGMVNHCTNLKAQMEKVRKTEFQIFFLVKDQWIKTKLELDLYLGMAKQWYGKAMYQI